MCILKFDDNILARFYGVQSNNNVKETHEEIWWNGKELTNDKWLRISNYIGTAGVKINE